MLKAYLQLFRIPNLASVIADIVAGFLLAHGTFNHSYALLPLMVCSCLLYTAGMVLNDYYDLEQDRRERPHRPLPSGAIDLAWAGRLGYLLLGVGVLLAWPTGLIFSANEDVPFFFAWRTGIVATILAVCIVAYDRWLKVTIAGPLCMGACRCLNILLGVSVATVSAPASSTGNHWFTMAQLAAAGAIGIYIAGVTLFAQTEAQESHRGRLLFATIVMGTGIILLANFPRWLPPDMFSVYTPRMPLLTYCLGAIIGWRCLRCIASPEPANVQVAVKTCLMSLIILDATIALAVSNAAYSVGILALLIPNVLLGRWIAST